MLEKNKVLNVSKANTPLKSGVFVCNILHPCYGQRRAFDRQLYENHLGYRATTTIPLALAPPFLTRKAYIPEGAGEPF